MENWKIHSMEINALLKNQEIKEGMTREMKKHLETNENENIIYQNMGFQESNAQREFYSLYQKGSKELKMIA